MYRWPKRLTASPCVAFVAACGGDDIDRRATLAGAATATGLSTLMTAADRAGALPAAGPFTAFAPTIDAFTALRTGADRMAPDNTLPLPLVDKNDDSPDASIAFTDIRASNGAIHVITQLLIPSN